MKLKRVLHTIGLVLVAVYVDGYDTPNLVTHVVDRCRHSSSSDVLSIAGSHPDKDGVGIRNAVDASQKGIPDPWTCVLGDDCKANEER